jgi:predicted nucleic acid-binding Zn ribbon protein
MENTLAEYKKCLICGKYTSTDESAGGSFCSNDCSVRYERCTNCGRYFPQGKGHSEFICSADCSIAYIMTKRYDQEKYVYLEEESA